MTFPLVLGAASLLGSVFGLLVARQSVPAWTADYKLLGVTFLMELIALLLLSSFHLNVLLLLAAVATAFLLSFSFFECRRAPRYPDYPESGDM